MFSTIYFSLVSSPLEKLSIFHLDSLPLFSVSKINQTCQKGEHKAAEWPDGAAQGAVVSVLEPLEWIELACSRETCEHIVITELDRTSKIN